MINTFKPYFKITKRFKRVKIHEWFWIHFEICNQINFSIEIYGYGFKIGVLIYDVLKEDKGDNNGT